MIHEALDRETEPLLTPEAVYGTHEKVCDVCVATFSYKVIEWALQHLDCEQAAEIRCSNGNRPIYLTEWKGKKIAAFLEGKKVPYVAGRTWTTDAVYRETSGKAGKLRKDGCIAVEMELAGMQAVCQYHGLTLKAFLFASDCLETEEWHNELLGSEHEWNMQVKCFLLALDLAML